MVKNLRLLREERGLSQQKLADMLNTTQQSIFKYEKSLNEPDIDTLIKISDIFEVSVDFLIGNSDIREKNNSYSEITLSEDETAHIKLWRSLSKQARKHADDFLKEIIKK